ncbi:MULTISPECIES: hypothetical protein [unclassified Streptomyces]|uniref:Uncharacterized protein n=1 Tax=Streptomyces sp. NBC_00093 TaxID=2975649 RepID=A0AAU2A5Q3_9ACTN|nr:hypothetical protein [Streptomyces sp. GQFP]UIX34313.1 hypothetical protein LUX31_32290 [Streptomyces sp. GQFP]
MEAQQVADLINQVSFRPGWEFRADVMADGAPLVIVQALVETVNSDRDQALRGYPEKILLVPEAIIDAAEYVIADDLYTAIFQWIIDLEIHECREFFRVGPDKDAPFHPHRPEGQSAWDAIVREPVAEDAGA